MGDKKASDDKLVGFTMYDTGVYVSKPDADQDQANVAQSAEHPQVVVVFGWMNAKAVHLQKYLDYYRSIYPNAVIIVARSWANFFSMGAKARLNFVEPTWRLLEKEGLFTDSPPSIIMHTFSNGGIYLFTELSRLTRLKGSGDSPATPTASCLVLDSCPGHFGFIGGLRAFPVGISFLPLRLLAYIPITLFMLWLMVQQKISGSPKLVTQIRAAVESPSPFTWMTKESPRVFIYSDADQMVEAEAIEECIEASKQKGLNVHVEKFHGSAHVSHARKDSGKYWSAVEKAWAEALETARQRRA